MTLESEQKSLSKVKVGKRRSTSCVMIGWVRFCGTGWSVQWATCSICRPMILLFMRLQFVWSVTRFLTTALCCLRKRVSFLNMKLPIFNEMKLLTYYCGRRKNLEFRSFQVHSQKYLNLFENSIFCIWVISLIQYSELRYIK